MTEKKWPHVREVSRLPPTLPGGRPWPRVSIVTTSLNQGSYIEETTLSILNQDYPDLERIVIDGSMRWRSTIIPPGAACVKNCLRGKQSTCAAIALPWECPSSGRGDGRILEAVGKVEGTPQAA